MTLAVTRENEPSELTGYAEPYLALDGIGKAFRLGKENVVAVRDVSLDIRRGEFVAHGVDLSFVDGKHEARLIRAEQLLERAIDLTQPVLDCWLEER